MNYYYDIKLDFQEINYQFYDFLKNDKITYYKKIPIIKISKIDLDNILNNNIKFHDLFLDSKEFLITDQNNVFGIMLDNDNNVIKYSPLNLIDELNILDIVFTIKEEKITYDVISKKNIDYNFRKELDIKNTIKEQLKNLIKNQDVEKLRYLYLEIYNKKEEDINIIYKKISKHLVSHITKKEEKLYNLLNNNYKNV